jgi:hypothetical protein
LSSCFHEWMNTYTEVSDIASGRKRLVRVTAEWLSRFAPKSKRDSYFKQDARSTEATKRSDALANDIAATETEQRDARVAAQEEQEKKIAMSDDLLVWRAENVERITEEVRERREALPAKWLPILAELRADLQESESENRALAFFRNDHPVKRDSPAPTTANLKLPGGNALSNLVAGLEALLPKTPVELVSQAEYRGRLARGEDVSRLRVSHSPDGFGPTGRGLA